MTRQRLRPAYSTEGLHSLYSRPYDHRGWTDHKLRIKQTIEVARWSAEFTGAVTGADLSAGDGAILTSIRLNRRVYGDISGQWPISGRIEETLQDLSPVDLYVCTESLEHLDDPDTVLKMIRGKSGTLILSTPVGAWEDTNPEHYWAWSRADVEDMLNQAGFTPFVYSSVDFTMMSLAHYEFGIWACQ